VGIGTSAPAVKQHIVDSSGEGNPSTLIAETFRVQRNSGSGSAAAATIVAGTAGQAGLYFGDASSVSAGGILYENGVDAMVMRVNSTERLRIDSSGNVLVGTTSSQSTVGDAEGIELRGGTKTGIFTRDSGIALFACRRGSDGTAIEFRKNVGIVGSISVTASATAYNTSSDYRLKEDAQPMVGAAERVLALKPVNFAWKVDGSRVDGFLAHEAQEVVPQAVTGEKDGEEMQSIDHSKLVPLLTAALQDALRRITILESQR
jgi:hypothetical protein